MIQTQEHGSVVLKAIHKNNSKPWKKNEIYMENHWKLGEAGNKIAGLIEKLKKFPMVCLLPNSGQGTCHINGHIDGLVQKRRNSIANALELRLSCINPTTYSSGQNETWLY